MIIIDLLLVLFAWNKSLFIVLFVAKLINHIYSRSDFFGLYFVSVIYVSLFKKIHGPNLVLTVIPDILLIITIISGYFRPYLKTLQLSWIARMMLYLSFISLVAVLINNGLVFASFFVRETLLIMALIYLYTTRNIPFYLDSVMVPLALLAVVDIFNYFSLLDWYNAIQTLEFADGSVRERYRIFFGLKIFRMNSALTISTGGVSMLYAYFGILGIANKIVKGFFGSRVIGFFLLCVAIISSSISGLIVLLLGLIFFVPNKWVKWIFGICVVLLILALQNLTLSADGGEVFNVFKYIKENIWNSFGVLLDYNSSLFLGGQIDIKSSIIDARGLGRDKALFSIVLNSGLVFFAFFALFHRKLYVNLLRSKGFPFALFLIAVPLLYPHSNYLITRPLEIMAIVPIIVCRNEDIS